MQNISKSYEQILMKFCGEVEHGQGGNCLDFGDDSDSFMDPGSFSSILYHLSFLYDLFGVSELSELFS